MANHDINIRHNLIINFLSKHPASFEEIMDYLGKNEQSFGCKLVVSKKQFGRDIKAILNAVGIEISFDFSNNVYKITDRFEAQMGNRYFEVMDIYTLMKRGQQVSKYFFIEERRPAGTDLLDPIFKAITERKKIRFSYKKHYDDYSSQRLVSPLAIKEALGRWYLLAHQDEKLKTFGLDRISNLEFTGISFAYPADFSMDKIFKDSFGILADENIKAEKVRIRATKFQGRYLHSYPLHHSQTLVEETPDSMTFELFIKPTFDLEMELLSHGETLEVLAPQWFRERIKHRLEGALAKYQQCASS